ncbi:MAG: hypothetical protein O3A46_09800 [Candidatus Poribacteria bacterium]|nr:hypothetical protein [Candidatus Poribacteria bacterium]
MGYVGGTAGAGIAAQQQAIAEAIKASGVLVRMERDQFYELLRRIEKPLVVTAEGGVFKMKYEYLTSYKGLAFYMKTDTPIRLPDGAETVVAGKIYIPG